MKKKSIILTTLICLLVMPMVLAGCVKQTSLLTEYDFLKYSEMTYRSEKYGDPMISTYRELLKKILYKNDGTRINKSGYAKFTKADELTFNFYPNWEIVNAALANESTRNTVEDTLQKAINASYLVSGKTIGEFITYFINDLFGKYVPGLNFKTQEGRADAILQLKNTIGLEIDKNEFLLSKEFQNFVDNLVKHNKLSELKIPDGFGFKLRLKLKSKKAVIPHYFKDGSDLTVIKRIASFSKSDMRDDNFLIFDEFDISKRNAKTDEIFDNIIGNRKYDKENNKAEWEAARKNVNFIMQGRIMLLQLDLIGVRA